MPWKNGGGATHEYFRERSDNPDDVADIEWRLSVADVATDGPFSSFPGLQRILVLLSGRGMRLAGPAHDVVLREPLSSVEFDGDADIGASLLDGPTTDLNLMWRPDHWSVTWSVCDDVLDDVAVDEIQVVYVAQGRFRLGELELGQGDAALRTPSEPAIANGSAVVFTLRHTTS